LSLKEIGMRLRPVPWLLVLAFGLCLASTPALARPAAAPAGSQMLQSAFGAAAREFGVPERVLLSVSYNVSRWESHGGAPSVAGGYGPMHLAQPGRPADARGDGATALRPPLSGFDTLARAASLLGLDRHLLQRDPAQNIRGGAALLAQYARDTTGRLPAAERDWYGAVARYSGSDEAGVALDFAEAVYSTMRSGAARTNSDGQRVALRAGEGTPNRDTVRALHLRNTGYNPLECPERVDCAFLIAAYRQTDPADATSYGNFDLAARPDDGLDIRYIVIHDTEIDYGLTVSVFQNPATAVSSHYLVRSSDGAVAQHVKGHNVAWHAGNWYINGHALGIEHEGVAIDGAAWYTDDMYRASAKLVRYLAQKYHVPLDRAHIIGHDEIPGPTPATHAAMHWDPGPFWDWGHYMKLLGAPIEASSGKGDPRIVTINPRFDRNIQSLTYCYQEETDDCRPVPPQPANFVWLRTAPDPAAPLIEDPYVGSDPTRANNWANKAVAGQRFVLADRRGDWNAIYFGGQIAWFQNPRGRNTAGGGGLMLTPRPGVESIPVYGRAYPEESAYPPDVAPQALVPIYDMPAGQIYVATDLLPSDYYWAPAYAPTPEDATHAVIRGQTLYFRIFYNHRFAYVKSNDVVIAPATPGN
jgi:N-acetyl-anhydromuramyl-L-alanine amidase AmpD